MPTTKELIFAIGIPFVIALFVRLIGGKVDPTRTWSSAAALALAVIVSVGVRLGSIPSMPPKQASGWLFYVAIVAGVFGAVEAFAAPRVLRALLVFIAGGAAGAMVLWFLQTSEQLSQYQYFAAVAGVATIALIWWSAIEQSAEQDGTAGALVMVVMSAAVAAMTGMSGSVSFGLIGGALTAALIAIIGARVFYRQSSLTAGLAAPWTVIAISLILCSRFLADLAFAEAIVLLAAPSLAFVGQFLAGQNRGWTRTILTVTCVLIPLAIVVGLTAVEFRKDIAAFE